MPTVIICPECGASIPAGTVAAELGRTGGAAKTDRKAAAGHESMAGFFIYCQIK